MKCDLNFRVGIVILDLGYQAGNDILKTFTFPLNMNLKQSGFLKN
jgi:hypothetical protein